MKRAKVWGLVLFGAVAVITGFTLFILRCLPDMAENNTYDAVQVIANEIVEQFARDPAINRAQMDQSILFLGKASVINIGVDPHGIPTDSYGTPFDIRCEVVGREAVVTVASAGRDRAFGTADDLRQVRRGPLQPQK